jgi:hypothetical protein
MLYKKFSDQWRENADTQNPDRATLAALATLAGEGVASRKNTEAGARSISVAQDIDPTRDFFAPESAMGRISKMREPTGAPAKVAKAAKVAESNVSPDPDDLAERAALIEEGAGVPRGWAEGYAALSVMSPPAGFTPQRWRRIVDAAGIFIDRWAAKAAECGWSATDVFGVHPIAPDKRFDAMGLVLLLDRAEVVDVDPDGADLIARAGGVRTRYYRRPVPPETISLWELAVAAVESIPVDNYDDIDA